MVFGSPASAARWPFDYSGTALCRDRAEARDRAAVSISPNRLHFPPGVGECARTFPARPDALSIDAVVFELRPERIVVPADKKYSQCGTGLWIGGLRRCPHSNLKLSGFALLSGNWRSDFRFCPQKCGPASLLCQRA